MPCWYWDRKDLENSPSRQAGLIPENEARYRKEGAKFIHKLGLELKLHHDTLATAAVFYHRFYQQHSFLKFRHRYVTATCCLFLAGKVEETPKKCKDLVRLAKQLLPEQQFAQFGNGQNAEVLAREEVMAMERVLLQAIKFDFNVIHPYKYIIEYAEVIRNDLEDKIDEKQMENLVQQSWNFTNDSLQTVLCLQWEPEIVAISMIFLSAKLAKIELLSATTKWWEKFIPDLTLELMESICHSVLDIYQSSKKKSKTPKRTKESSHSEGTPTKRPKEQSNPNESILKDLILQNLGEDKLRQLVRSESIVKDPALQIPEPITPRLSVPVVEPQPFIQQQPATPVPQPRPMGTGNFRPQYHTPQPQRGGAVTGAWRPSTPQSFGQPHGGFMQQQQQNNMQQQHPGYQGQGWDTTPNGGGGQNGPRGGRRGYGPNGGGGYGQGGYGQGQWR